MDFCASVEFYNCDIDIECNETGIGTGFPIVYHFHRLIVDIPRLPSYVIYNSQLVRFARCCTSVSTIILNICK